jgi:hypothetical protein
MHIDIYIVTRAGRAWQPGEGRRYAQTSAMSGTPLSASSFHSNRTRTVSARRARPKGRVATMRVRWVATQRAVLQLSALCQGNSALCCNSACSARETARCGAAQRAVLQRRAVERHGARPPAVRCDAMHRVASCGNGYNGRNGCSRCSRSIHGEYPLSTHATPLEFPTSTPTSTPRVPHEYPMSTPRVPHEYPTSTPRVPLSTLEYPTSTREYPIEYRSIMSGTG